MTQPVSNLIFRYQVLFTGILWITFESVRAHFGTGNVLEPVGQRQCLKPVPIQIPECLNTFYNFTGMPNLVNQETQLDAEQQLQTFKPLIVYKCSRKLTFFLCSVYTPMCDVNTRHLIGPCRPLCEHVKARCAPVLRVFDFDWPIHLNCSRFPVKNTVGGTMCMEGPYDSEESIMTPEEELYRDPNALATEAANEDHVLKLGEAKNLSTTAPVDTGLKKEERILKFWIRQVARLQTDEDLDTDFTNPPTQSISVMARSLRYCSHLKKPTFYVYINRTGRCAPLCRSHILFKEDAKYWSAVWTGVVTGICFFTTAFTLIGYLTDPSFFQVTERPVVYIALCQLIHSLAFAVSLSIGREAATCGKDLDTGLLTRLQEGLDNSVCVLVFMMQFFFSLASSIWWVLLTIHWVATRKQLGCSRHASCLESVDLQNAYHLSSLAQNKCTLQPSYIKRDQCCNAKLATKTADMWTDSNYDKRDHTEDINGSTIPKHLDKINPQVPMTALQTHSLSHPYEATPYFVQQGRLVPSYRYLYLRGHSRLYTETKDRLSACLAREHIIVWLTASLFTVGVLVSRQVDADELVPVCGVGRQNIKAMGAFVIGPQVTLIVIGTLWLLAGILFMLAEAVRHRGQITETGACTRSGELPTSDNSVLLRSSPVSTAVEQAQQTTEKETNTNHSVNNPGSLIQDKSNLLFGNGFVRRLGLFCFLYFIPALCVTSCDVYEYMNREIWLSDTGDKLPPTDEHSELQSPAKIWKSDETFGPSPEIFMLRIFMSFVPGLTCTLWICSGKGCGLYRHLCKTIKSFPLYCRNMLPRFKGGKLVLKAQNRHKGLNFHFPPADPLIPTTSITPIPRPPFTLCPYPYAVYQYHPSLSVRDPLDTSMQPAWPNTSDACAIQAVVNAHNFEMQHSNNTTPGYYSQAKVGSVIQPNQSDNSSEESPIPPPLPVSARPQILLVKNDTCTGLLRTNVNVQSFENRSS